MVSSINIGNLFSEVVPISSVFQFALCTSADFHIQNMPPCVGTQWSKVVNITRKFVECFCLTVSSLKPSLFYQICPVISDENTSPPQTRFNVFLYILLIERITFPLPKKIGIVNKVIPVFTSLWCLTETVCIQERKYC